MESKAFSPRNSLDAPIMVVDKLRDFKLINHPRIPTDQSAKMGQLKSWESLRRRCMGGETTNALMMIDK
jgi:hypothetical protein